MKKITIISGKGGTGKTSLTASFAAITRNRAIFVDGDVDAANLSLITGPTSSEKFEFRASRVVDINKEKCEDCGLCFDLCRFAAISGDYVVDPISCEGCGFCYHVCPHDAIRMREELSGLWYISQTPYGILVHARLGIAEENSGKLVTTIRTRGEELAVSGNKEYIIIDGPPGIGCPVIASLTGVDAALIVTEPSVSGIHDLERILAVCRHFDVPAAVCINRYDLDEERSAVIESYCLNENICIAGKIPYDKIFTEAMIQGLPVVEYDNGQLSAKINAVWEHLIG